MIVTHIDKLEIFCHLCEDDFIRSYRVVDDMIFLHVVNGIDKLRLDSAQNHRR